LTVSGIGAVVHPPNSQNNHDWVTEGDTKKYWERDAGLFDGTEQLNATEVVKRGLKEVLPKLLKLDIDESDIAASYPDLTAGVAGYLKVMQEQEYIEDWQHFQKACNEINQKYPWTKEVINGMQKKWGIPWMDNDGKPQKYHPRLLNAGWLLEDAESEALKELGERLKNEDDEEVKEEIRQNIHKIKISYRESIQTIIDRYYPNSNLSDWYVYQKF
jgi:CRISPR-associated protein Cmr2